MSSYVSLMLYALIAIVLALGLGACEREGPAEQAGEKIDQAVEQAGDKVEQATDSAHEAVEEAGDKIESKTAQ